MKKIIVAILAFLYLGVSSGVAMEIHYCMGKTAGVDFYSGEKEKCSKCGMKPQKGGCCSDEHKFYKLNDSHKNVSNDLSFEGSFDIISNTYTVFDFLLVTKPLEENINNHSPPEGKTPSLCILNCVFRI